MALYDVTVGNVGYVLSGSRDKKLAEQTYKDYVALSESGTSRAAGEQVVLWQDGEPIKEHPGTVSE